MGWGGGKRLSYRSYSGASEEEHVDHWRGFTWSAGPVVVKLKGNHGELQVWAASESEGRRVIGHACSIAGIDPDASDCWWETYTTSSTRNGKPGTFRTREVNGFVHVSMRDGPNGSPWWTAGQTE